MTPSILAPLNAAPAQLSGPQTADSSAQADAGTAENASFRDLVAQEGQQPQREGDLPGEQAPTGQGDESKGYNAATEREAQPTSGDAVGQGGQSLPPAAASFIPNGSVQTATPAAAPTAPISDTNPTGSPVASPPQAINATAPPAATAATAATAAAAAPGASGAGSRGAGQLRGDATTGSMRSDVLDGTRRTRSWDGQSSDPGALASRQAERTPLVLDGLRTMLGERAAFASATSLGLSQERFGISQAPGTQGGVTSATGPVAGAAIAPTAGFSVEPMATTASSNPTSLELSQPLGSQAWQQELGGRLQWLTDARIGRAELRMNPAELGPLEITLNVSGDEVSATFGAQHAATREAVEQALPRLREMMAQSGLQLTDANVGQHSGGEQTAQNDDRASAQQPPLAAGRDSTTVQAAELTVDSASSRRMNVGQLDLYA